MRRRSSQSIVANPVLVGAVTTLVTVVAVFLAYNANQGLPFVPTTQLKVHSTSGSNLLPGNDVRSGGYRIGIVDDMKAIRLPDGTTGAEITLKLDKSAGGIPEDSRVNLRPRSVLGLKYVDIERGKSKNMLEDGATMPVDQTTYPVDLNDFFGQYDERTRNAVRGNLREFGTALNRRGESLNRTIERAPSFLGHLEVVARSLSAESTQLPRFFREIGDAVRVLAPVADRYAHQFSAGADTFEAWSRCPECLDATIRKSAPTLDAGIKSFRVQRPFLTDLAAMSRSLRRVAQRLPSTLPRITPALLTGTRTQRRAPELNTRLEKTLAALRRLVRDPATPAAINGFGRTGEILNPALRFIGPYITVCNYFNYSFTHVGEHVTEPDPTGSSQRTLLNQIPRNRNPSDPSIGSIGASRPANNEPVMSGRPVALHSNVYSAAIDEQGNADCESGQRGYIERQARFVEDKKLKIVVDPHIPGNQGPTFSGRPRVPEGMTFTRSPQSGPQMHPELINP